MLRKGCLAAALAVALLLAGPTPASSTEHVSLGVSPGDAFSNSGQQAPFGLAVKSVGQTFETPDAKQTMITKFVFYMSRAQPAPRYIVPLIYKWDPALQVVKGKPVFTGEPTILTAAADRDNAAIVIETRGVNLAPATPYIAIFTTIQAGNAGPWAPLSSINYQVLGTYAQGKMMVSSSDSLEAAEWNAGVGRSLSFYMAFEQPLAAASDSVSILSKANAGTIRSGASKSLKIVVKNTGNSPISGTSLVVTAPPQLTLLRVTTSPKDKTSGFSSSSWTQAVNLAEAKSRSYTYKVQVGKCEPSGTFTLTTMVHTTVGPTIKLTVKAPSKKPPGC